jgi:PAS domain S-box-containing protein
VIVTDVDADPLWEDFRELAGSFGLRACWSTPILSPDGTVLGTFAVYYDRVLAPREYDMELVDLVARTASIAIGRHRLERDRERTLRIVQTLNEIGEAVSSRVDLHDVVQVVTDAATRVTGAQFGAFFYNVIRSDGEAYTLYTISGVPREKFERFPMPRNTKVFDPTFRGEGVIRLEDVTKDERYGHNAPYYGMPEGHLPVHSYLAAPVLDPDGEVLGGLFFGHSEPGRFTKEHEEIVVGIAAQAAIAIVNSRLYEREQHARAEAEARSRAAFSLEHIDNGVVLVDTNGTVLVWNRAAAAITGVPAEEANGQRLDEIVTGWDAATEQLRSASGASGQTVPVEVGGREVWLEVSATRFQGGIVFAFKDVTDERRLEAMRNDLIATVSHELRTPVTAVFGAVKTLERDDVRSNEEMARTLFEIVKSESTRLVQLVEEILLASNLDRGSVVVASDPVDALEVAREAAAGFAPAGAEISVDGDSLCVVADGHRLRQVLDNLLDNALKYSDGAPVEVTVRPDRASVRIDVADHGPGIPEAQRVRIFEKFVRLDPDMQGGVNGTGLGLYIARELVDRMQGRLRIESRRDGAPGALFSISLPAA